MVKLVNRAKVTTPTIGTGTLALGPAVDGFQSFANAGVMDGDVLRYVIEDGNNWEIGLGTYSTTGTTLTRGTIESSDADNALNLTGNAVVYVSAAAADLQELVDFADKFVLPTADGTNGQVLTTNGSGTLTFTTVTGYTDADVDDHLNTSTAASGEVLSWNGTDYDWVAVSGGATDINGLSDGYSDGSSVGLGSGALANDDGTSNQNTAVGINAGDSLTSGYRNVIVGNGADASSTARESVVLGFEANAISRESVAVGSGAQTAINCVSVGYWAGRTSGGGNSSVAVGRQAGFNVVGFGNVSVGNDAAYNITSGTYNQAIGFQALYGSSASKLTGSHNTGIGYQTGYDLTTGANNFLGGYQAGTNLTTGSNNVAIGNEAMLTPTTGSGNIAIGWEAMELGATTGINNTCVGVQAGRRLTFGQQNTCIGDSAGANILSGSWNTFVGRDAGFAHGFGTNNVAIGNGAATSTDSVSNEITLGNASITTLRCQVTTITSLSDARDKTDIQPLNAGLEFVEALNPVSFTWNMRDGGKVGVADTGFIAQDLQAAQADTGVSIPGLVYDVNPDKLEAGYGKLIPVLVQAIKDLSAKVNLLEAQLEAQK